jgi:type II secretory ATPase GspE/PulE/Tfp pilus assembly ATPase PilB-like protein
MRDLETVEAALKIAETGHLTFGTLHTNSAAQTINRIIDIFRSGQQAQIRTQLSLVLEGIVCQALLPRADGRGASLRSKFWCRRRDSKSDSRRQGPSNLRRRCSRGRRSTACRRPTSRWPACHEAADHARNGHDGVVDEGRVA